MGRGLALKRHNSITKALRKEKISKNIYGKNFSYYDNLHQYSKNKVHCSCSFCSEKTNNKAYKSKGRVDTFVGRSNQKCAVRGTRLATTNHRQGKKHYKKSDRVKIDRLNYIEGRQL